jgi:hypothetical protein
MKTVLMWMLMLLTRKHLKFFDAAESTKTDCPTIEKMSRKMKMKKG